MSNKKRLTPHWMLSGAVAIVATSGCALLSSTGAVGPSEAEVTAAFEQGNQTYLADACTKGQNRPSILGVPPTENEKLACRLSEQLLADDAENSRVGELESFVAGLTCDDTVETFLTYVETNPGGDHEHLGYIATGKKVAECGNYESLVVDHLSLHSSWGQELIAELGDADPELEDKLTTVTTGNNFTFTGSEVSADTITRWLIDQAKLGTCDAFIAGLDSTNSETLQVLASYHGQAKCTAAGDKIAGLLSSERDYVRFRACTALGRIGDAKHIKKLQVVSETDSAYQSDAFVKVYFVRDECRDAIGKIKLAQP